MRRPLSLLISLAMTLLCALSSAPASGLGQGGITRHHDYVIGDVDWSWPGQDGGGGSSPGTVRVHVFCDHCATTYIQNACDSMAATKIPCTGPPAKCPVGMERWDVRVTYYSGVEDKDSFFCRTPGTDPIPDLPGGFGDARAALELKIPPVTVQPAKAVLPVTLDAFYEATKLTTYTSPPSAGPGGTAWFVASDPHYIWDFGDGSPTLTTTSNGGKYPDGDVRHPYATVGPYTTTLRISWHADLYFTITGFAGGPYGPVPSPNNPEVTLGTKAVAVNVVEAHAVLVG